MSIENEHDQEQESQEQQPKGLTRRSFLKNTGIGLAVGGGTLLVGCSPNQATPEPTEIASGPAVEAATNTGGPTVMNAELASQKWAFEIPPEPIPDSEIANTVKSEIIIIGAGVSGLVAANSAAENGAKIVLIAASSAPVYRGGSFHAPYSRHMDELGVEKYDVTRFFREQLSTASFNVDQNKWYKFYNNSEEAIDWLIEKMEAAGYETVLEHGNIDENNGPMHTQVGSHCWLSEDMRRAGMAAEFVVQVLEEKAKEAGVEIRYKTIARQLVREDDNTGRVSAVIAEGEDGKYTKYVGSKAIIMATGDFSANKEMMAKYCPWVVDMLHDRGDQGYDNTFKFGGLFKGDGHKMGLWVGAAWQRTFPNAPMIMGKWTGANQPYGTHRGLLVNVEGKRFTNEDINGPFEGIVQIRQPEKKAFAIWDSTYAEKAQPWYSFGMVEGADPIPPETIAANWESIAKSEGGTVVKGDTIEEVLEKFGLPEAETKATIERYNELCDKGVDEDYHKAAKHLVSIKEGPFYGGFLDVPDFLTVMGGLRTNDKMQVCDENDTPIPGLFNLGTMIGDYYANIYNYLIAGNNLGACCLTFGYMTGRDIAQNAI